MHTRPAFHDDNTQGYSPDDLDALNEAHEILMADTDETNEFMFEQDWKNYVDRLHNAWFDGATVEQLVAAVRGK